MTVLGGRGFTGGAGSGGREIPHLFKMWGACGGRAAEGPDAGAAWDALGQHAEVGAGADEGFFHHADEVDGPQKSVARAALAGPFAAQVEDGVADQLAGTVIGDIAAAVDLVELDAARSEELIAGDDVGAGGVAA